MATGHTQGLIVGSGLADLAADAERLEVDTPYGRPSAPLRRVNFGDEEILLLPRHGDRHDIAPHLVNYRANIVALKSCGVRSLVCLNTVGVIPDRPAPGQLAVPAQLIDYTWGREHTLCDGAAAPLEHIEFTEPFCRELRARLLAAAAGSRVPCHDGGVYGVTQGPRLETAAEIDRYERDGVAFVGMTAMPEVALAREAGMQVACLSMVVNAAAGRGDGAIHANIEASMAVARRHAMAVIRAFYGE